VIKEEGINFRNTINLTCVIVWNEKQIEKEKHFQFKAILYNHAIDMKKVRQHFKIYMRKHKKMNNVEKPNTISKVNRQNHSLFFYSSVHNKWEVNDRNADL
jgi:mRNA degradation ribonuclease J1/J2